MLSIDPSVLSATERLCLSGGMGGFIAGRDKAWKLIKHPARKRKLGSNTFIATQPGIIATIYLSPIALLKKNKTPYKVLYWPVANGL